MLAILLFVSIFSNIANAQETESSIATKTATPVDGNGRYEVEIQVPGGDGEENYDEIIVMVDGSYSTDDDWETTRSAILEIGKTVLEGSGNTKLTVMTFGMADNIVVQDVETVAELDSKLTDLPGGLLYGRSSTNCEAGFTGIAEYIDSQGDALNQVHVVYITDGEINTDETPYVFYNNWKDNSWLKKDLMTLVRWSLGEECFDYGAGRTELSNAYKTVFGEKIYSAEETEDKTVISDEEALAWADKAWEDVYNYSGMDPDKAYPVSDAERAFVKYDKENNTHIQEIWYYTLWGRSYPDRYTRTPAAGIELAQHSKVEHLYMVDSNQATSWMSGMVEKAENVSFYESGSVSNLVETLEGVLTNLSYTPYNDVVVTDYMSKWVNLDTMTIKVVDNYSGNTIWTNDDGWLITENRPTSQNAPVVIEEVDSDYYAEGGANVIGNENGIIYKLTWFVKDGAMLRNHNYSLVYEVDVDTQETGFEYNTFYPANGKTTITYIEKKGNEEAQITENISVPDVIVEKECPETITIQGTKTWIDVGNEDKRPESITIRLYADGVEVKVLEVKPATQGAIDVVTNSAIDVDVISDSAIDIENTTGSAINSKWTYDFGELPKYNENNLEIVYTISEDSVSNYIADISGFDIVNTYTETEIIPNPDPTPSPSPSPDPTPSPSPAPTPGLRPNPTPSPSPNPDPSIDTTPSPSPVPEETKPDNKEELEEIIDVPEDSIPVQDKTEEIEQIVPKTGENNAVFWIMEIAVMSVTGIVLVVKRLKKTYDDNMS